MNRYIIARRWPLVVMPYGMAVSGLLLAATMTERPRDPAFLVGLTILGAVFGLGYGLEMCLDRDPEGGPR